MVNAPASGACEAYYRAYQAYLDTVRHVYSGEVNCVCSRGDVDGDTKKITWDAFWQSQRSFQGVDVGKVDGDGKGDCLRDSVGGQSATVPGKVETVGDGGRRGDGRCDGPTVFDVDGGRGSRVEGSPPAAVVGAEKAESATPLGKNTLRNREWRRQKKERRDRKRAKDDCEEVAATGFWNSCSPELRAKLVESKAAMHLAENRRKTAEATARADFLASPQALLNKAVKSADFAKKFGEKASESLVYGYAQTLSDSYAESAIRSLPSSVTSYADFAKKKTMYSRDISEKKQFQAIENELALVRRQRDRAVESLELLQRGEKFCWADEEPTVFGNAPPHEQRMHGDWIDGFMDEASMQADFRQWSLDHQ